MGLARPRPYPSPPADGGGTGAHALPCVPSGPHSPIRQWLAEPSPEHEEEPHPRRWPVLLGAAEPRLPPPSVRHGLELAGPTCSHLYLNLRVVSEADRTGGPGPALGAWPGAGSLGSPPSCLPPPSLPHTARSFPGHLRSLGGLHLPLPKKARY